VIRTPLRLEPYEASKHYALIASWWRAQADAKCLPSDALPPTGVIVTRDGRPIAACFVYLCTGTTAAYLAFPVCAPALRAGVSLPAIKLAVRGALDLARHAGCKLVWSATENMMIDRTLARVGFTRTTPHHNYFMLLDQAVSHDMLVGDDYEKQRG